MDAIKKMNFLNEENFRKQITSFFENESYTGAVGFTTVFYFHYETGVFIKSEVFESKNTKQYFKECAFCLHKRFFVKNSETYQELFFNGREFHLIMNVEQRKINVLSYFSKRNDQNKKRDLKAELERIVGCEISSIKTAG